MESSSISSKYLEEAVNQLSKLPGIGKKSALRIVMHLLNQEDEKVTQLTEALETVKTAIQYCKTCHNISDAPICLICLSPSRDKTTICIVESIRDVISIESTGQYNGLYHVLGGLIAPLSGVGPDQLHINSLENRCVTDTPSELIMALSPNIEGDTTVYYISKLLKSYPNIRITSIARGISFGGDLEFADEFTLGKALLKRLPVESYITN